MRPARLTGWLGRDVRVAEHTQASGFPGQDQQWCFNKILHKQELAGLTGQS